MSIIRSNKAVTPPVSISYLVLTCFHKNVHSVVCACALVVGSTKNMLYWTSTLSCTHNTINESYLDI